MLPISSEAAGSIIASEGFCRRSSALRHAWIRGRGGFWGDHPRRPTSIVLLRDGIGQLDIFAAGKPEPALAWLSQLEGPMALLAPSSWAESIRGAIGPVDLGLVESRFRPEGAPPIEVDRRASPQVPVRQLYPEDAARFLASGPSWSLLGWDSASELILDGASFGVDQPGSPTFAALAWILESAGSVDLIGVWVSPRFRRLGLGFATASRLVDHVVSVRCACPLWALHIENRASRSLALSLGFTLRSREPLWRWPRGEVVLSGGD